MRDEVYSFPYEVYLEIENQPFFKGRIVVNKVSRGFMASIDIITTENQKIYKHVGEVFEPHEASEALDLAVYKLEHFLKNAKTI